MSDLYARGARIFGKGQGGVFWPYDVSGIDRSLRQSDPERFRQEHDALEAKRLVLVEWADRFGLRPARGCCPRWLLKNSSHRCGWQPSARLECTWSTDERWLDHAIWWIKDRRPTAVTGAPYLFDDRSRSLVERWLAQDTRLNFATGTGWYGYGTTQTLLWRADRIADIAPAAPLNGAAPCPE
jgi:hypothetical protein